MRTCRVVVATVDPPSRAVESLCFVQTVADADGRTVGFRPAELGRRLAICRWKPRRPSQPCPGGARARSESFQPCEIDGAVALHTTSTHLALALVAAWGLSRGVSLHRTQLDCAVWRRKAASGSAKGVGKRRPAVAAPEQEAQERMHLEIRRRSGSRLIVTMLRDRSRGAEA
jgi:hypothetical protein